MTPTEKRDDTAARKSMPMPAKKRAGAPVPKSERPAPAKRTNNRATGPIQSVTITRTATCIRETANSYVFSIETEGDPLRYTKLYVAKSALPGRDIEVGTEVALTAVV